MSLILRLFVPFFFAVWHAHAFGLCPTHHACYCFLIRLRRVCACVKNRRAKALEPKGLLGSRCPPPNRLAVESDSKELSATRVDGHRGRVEKENAQPGVNRSMDKPLEVPAGRRQMPSCARQRLCLSFTSSPPPFARPRERACAHPPAWGIVSTGPFGRLSRACECEVARQSQDVGHFFLIVVSRRYRHLTLWPHWQGKGPRLATRQRGRLRDWRESRGFASKRTRRRWERRWGR